MVGPLRLVRADGVDVTPRTLKAQGLLALLGASPGLRKSRAYVQDKLWSDHPAENGAASLRQTVHRLRLAVGPDSDWLISEAGWLGLDPARVSVVMEPDASDWGASGDPPEFCEGLDIADPEFEEWLRDMRFAFEDRMAALGAPPPNPIAVRPAPAPRPTRVILLVAPVKAEDGALEALAEVLLTEVAMAVGRMGGAEILLEDHASMRSTPDEAMRFEVTACRQGSHARVQARFSEAGVLMWSNSRAFPLAGASGGAQRALEGFISEVTAAAAHHLGRSGDGESQIRAGYRALERMFTLEGATLADCDRVFATTSDVRAVHIHQAWRAQIRVFSVIERLPSDPSEACREAKDLIAEALSADPLNPIINAIASDVAMHIEDNPVKAAHLAKLAVARDPFSPYARASSAQALAWLGDAPKAHVETLRALRLAAGLPNQSLWLIRCCVTAVRCRRFKEALRYAQAAHDLAPAFRPPLRFLAALRFHAREEAAAAEALARLKVLEPDFSLDLMEREDYPVTSLRGTPLFEVTRSGLI